ncbi:GNAT family N-acetyltransferase [Bdellovibrio sp. HCB337]|uniref:GNAT family N-acetyltransferase n=1 Tax=Bdellovibrio sp. HCB337 TaxID=3394358 RepID=UPI0039A4C2E0
MRKTKRLILRPLELSDYENWRQTYSMLASPQNEWDEGPWKDSELTLAKFKALLKTEKSWRALEKFYVYGVFDRNDGVLLGEVRLMDISRGIFQNAYLGYRIFSHFWGQGYATEACRAVIDIAFKDLKLHRIEAAIEPHNKVSIKVAKKLGLRKEGLSSRRLQVRGKWKDMLVYAGTTEDFKGRSKK